MKAMIPAITVAALVACLTTACSKPSATGAEPAAGTQVLVVGGMRDNAGGIVG